MASTPCPRCGTFAPLSTFWGKTLCDACIARQPSVFRGPLTVPQLCSALIAIPLRVWLLSAALHLLVSVPSMLRTFFAVGGVRGYGMNQVLDMIAAAIVTHLCVQTLRSERAELGAAVRTVGQRFGTLFRVELLGSLLVLLLFVLLIVPGVLRALALALTIPIVLFESVSTFEEAAKRSTARMHGQRAAALSVYVIVVLPTLVALTIGAFVVEDGDLSLRARILETVFEGVGVILGAGTTLVTSLLYVSLTPPDTLPVMETLPTNREAASTSAASSRG